MSRIKLNHWEDRTVSDLMSIELETDLLANCKPPYTGESVADLIDYLYSLDNYEEFTEVNKDILGEELEITLYDFLTFSDPAREYYDSSDNGADTSITSGEDDESAFDYYMNR